jgi:competence protein ComEC
MKGSHLKLILTATLFSVAVFLFFLQVSPQEGFLEVHFLSVGQGDAVFIEAPGGQQVLVDAGPDTTVLRELAKVMPFWDRSIDMVVATHPDMDHIGGFPEIFQRFDVGTVLDNGASADSGVYEAYVYERDREGADIVTVRAGQVISLGEVYIEVLFPGNNAEDIKDRNDSSVVLRVVYGENEVLLTGDASKKIERFLVAKYGDSLQSDILKLGHHGSKTSTDKIFLETVSPEVVVISAGEGNRYGHPHEDVMDTVRAFGAEILSTQDGVISFKMNLK